jgi:sterol desaturase/sphingolipid hydroxylase (fatty acid hydroxylase superfamily)
MSALPPITEIALPQSIRHHGAGFWGRYTVADIRHALYYLQVAGGIFVAMIILERAYWIRLDRLSVYDLREVFSNISTGILYKGLDGVVVAIFITRFYDDVVNLGLQHTFTYNLVKVAALFLAADFVFYFLHRLMHKSRFAWCSHVTHHSSPRFNLSTALRQNFLFDLSGLAILWCLPLALIGFDKMSVVVAIELNLFYQFFIHTEVIGRLPAWCEAIFNTPSHHRVHHGSVPDQMERNFGGVLIVWDRLFGTFVDERDAGAISYGVSYRKPQTLNPLRLNLDEWFGMWRDVWIYKDFRILWKHPDWVEKTYRNCQDAG